jgi:predicted nucleotidyltransferase
MNVLAELLSSRVKAEVLRLLFGPGAQELHVREIARRARLNDATVRQELRRLTRVGVIVARRDGNRTCYRANPEHPLHPDIRSLVRKTSGLAGILHEALQGQAIRTAFVFGSLAAGEEEPGSDVDLMVVGTMTMRDLARRLKEPAERLGREINPHILSVAEFDRRRRAEDHFLAAVLRGPRLFVVGDERELAGLGR